MLIALIDDGIQTSLFQELRLKYDLSVREDGTINEREAEETIITNHGTICAKIIIKYAPDTEFISLRIFHKETLHTSCTQLVAALKWCLNAKIPIVHMSVGTGFLNDYIEIRPIIAKMIQQRQMIVAAYSNSDIYSIPACCSGVFGVIANKKLTDHEYSFIPSTSFQCTISASSSHTLMLNQKKEFTTQTTNSYAAPTVTAAIYNIISKCEPFSMSFRQVFKQLTNKDAVQYFKKPDFIEDASIVNPCNYPILKQHLFFNYSVEYTGKLTLECFGEKKSDIVFLAPHDFSDINRINTFLQNNDSMYKSILYGGILPLESQLRYRTELMWSEDVINFDDCQYSSSVHLNTDCPIINIYGNGLEPIDMLCQLRNMFIKDKYQCVCLCNYHFSYLYGLEYIPNHILKSDAIAYMNHIYNPDVIITNFQTANWQMNQNTDEFSVVFENTADDANLKCKCHNTNYKVIPVKFNEKDILSVYSRIIEYFN